MSSVFLPFAPSITLDSGSSFSTFSPNPPFKLSNFSDNTFMVSRCSMSLARNSCSARSNFSFAKLCLFFSISHVWSRVLSTYNCSSLLDNFTSSSSQLVIRPSMNATDVNGATTSRPFSREETTSNSSLCSESKRASVSKMCFFSFKEERERRAM